MPSFLRFPSLTLALFAGVGCATAGAAKVDPVSAAVVTPASPGLKAIRVNGTVLNYVDSASAAVPANRPAIILVHGTLGYWREWRNQIGPLSANQRVIAYSRRYHQPNPQVDDGLAYSPRLHADDLVAFIQALHLGPVDLVGSSYGGTVVTEVARLHPELVHALILAEPALDIYNDSTGNGAIMQAGAASLAGVDSARRLFARGDSIGGLRTFFDATMGTGAYDGAPPPARAYFISQILELRKEMSVPQRAWIPELQCADLRPLTMPVLLLIGEQTLGVYRGMAQQLQRCVPGTTVKTISGAGHHLADNSAELNRVITEFLTPLYR